MADNGYAKLDGMLARVRALDGVVERAMPAIRAGIAAELRRQIASGEKPTGKPWKKTADGEQALKNAAAAITIGLDGLDIRVTLSGVEARHHYGWVRGGVKRQVLPKPGTIPDAFATVINDALGHEFDRTMGGK